MKNNNTYRFIEGTYVWVKRTRDEYILGRVVKRTYKYVEIKLVNACLSSRQKIKYDDNGNEYMLGFWYGVYASDIYHN